MSRLDSLTQIRPRMGTFLAVTVGSWPGADRDRAVRVAFEAATAWERVLSRHDPRTPLSRLNQAAGNRAGVRSPDLAASLRLARKLSALTEGAFDPTVGPLLDVWRQASHRGMFPAPAALERARLGVDWRAITIRGAQVSLARYGMVVDAGAFGKGLALDRIAARFRNQAPAPVVLNFGESSLRAIGPMPPGGWSVLLRHPLGGFAGAFTLRDAACSTSGTGGRIRIGGRSVSHLVDPRSGLPLQGVAQTTVIARSAAVAEAVSTALLVLGRAAMRRIAERLRVEACWIDESGIYRTPGFVLWAQASKGR